MVQPIVSTLSSTPSARELELTNTFAELCDKYQIKVLIDPIDYKINSPAAIDIEHDEEGNLVGVGVYDGVSQKALYFTGISDMLRDMLLQSLLIGHNAKSDFEQLRAWGIPLSDDKLIHDTFLIGHILDSSLKSYGLKDMAKRELGIEYPSYDDIVGKHKGKTKKTPKCPQNETGCCDRRTLDKWPIEIASKYNALDTYCTFKLYEKQIERLTGGHDPSLCPELNYFEDLEKPVSHVFSAMELRGTRIDVPFLNEVKADLEGKIEPIKQAILSELGDINLNSPTQLLKALHEKGIKPELKGKPSTDKRALDKFKDNKNVSALLAFSELETLLSSFVYPYLERKTAVVHPFFNQCGTRTGRPSCSNPNLLQIPRRTDNGKLVRRMFIPRDGMLMGDCDYGQIEPRVLAHLSKDPTLCQMFNEGTDFHTFTAERLNISRDRAKVLNLSVGYRATFKSVMSQLGVSKDEAQAQINKWWSLFPQLRRWQETLIYTSKRSGFCTTLLGRRIKVDGLTGNTSWQREAAERQLINNITQGSAAEIMKKAMIKINKDTDLSASFGLLVQVYDELLFESPEIENDMFHVKFSMTNAVKLEVPLTVDSGMGPNWTEAKG